MSFAIILKLTFKSRACYSCFCHRIAKWGDCKVVLYNYVLCWLYFMTKSVVIALILFPCILWDFIVLGLVLIWWRIEHEMKISSVSRVARKMFARKVPAKRAREKHMLEAKESSVRLHSESTSRDRPFHRVPMKLFA